MAPKFKTTKKRHDHGTGQSNGGDNNNLISDSLQSNQEPQQQPEPQKQTPPPPSQPQISQPQQQLQKSQPQPPQQHQNGIDSNSNGNHIVNNATKNMTASSFDHIKTTTSNSNEKATINVQQSQVASTPSPMPPLANQAHLYSPLEKTKEKNYCYKASVAASTFSWDAYLTMMPAQVAPKEAFRQATEHPKNLFEIGMKLEAKDPRNSSNWCLASVVCIEGLHLRMRFVGADKMNDIYELIDSENIRPVGSSPSDLLLAPTGFTGNIAAYPKFVEKVLRNDTTIIAPPEYFPPTPRRPPRNLFERGMKIEAVDQKNRDFIYPATVGAVDGDMILVVFDGFRGSFDYRCEYYSRDIFPINWCRDTGRAIQSPNLWDRVLQGEITSWWPPNLKLGRASPTLNGLAKHNNGKANQSQASPKKGRGRPKKNFPKDQNKISREKQSRPVSSTPKKIQHTSPSITQEESHMSPSPPVSDCLLTKTEDISNIDRYQCQRTVSYDEWQKRKHQAQMPPIELSDYVRNIDDNNVNLSDTISMASTLSTSQRRESTDEPESCNKKMKTETNISSNFQQLLDSKPTKLSSWSVDDVVDIIKTESSLVKYIDTFQENEIDGKAFGLFDEKKRDLLMSMGLKLGPVLKILNLREVVADHVDTSDIATK